MDDDAKYRAQLDFLARLALVEDFKALSPDNLVALTEGLTEAFPALDNADGYHHRLGKFDTETYDFLARLHGELRATLLPLLNGAKVPLRRDAQISLALADDGRVVAERRLAPETPLGLLEQELTPGNVLPWKLCPHDGRVFRRDGKRIYCSSACAQGATEGARREEKREYMRLYQRARRLALRAKANRKRHNPSTRK